MQECYEHRQVCYNRYSLLCSLRIILRSSDSLFLITRVPFHFHLTVVQEILLLLLLLLLLPLLGRSQSTPHGSLSPANLVSHSCWQADSGDPGVRLHEINKCANLSSDAPFAMPRFPQKQIANNFIFTPPAMTTGPEAYLSKLWSRS